MLDPQALIIIAGLIGLATGIWIGIKWRRQIRHAKAELQRVRLRGIEHQVFVDPLRQRKL